MPRDMVFRATLHEMSDDEVIEVWLKRGADLWMLELVVAVETVEPTQDFPLVALEDAVDHVLQLRAFRDGRYRAGYLGSDPDGWPAQSRFEFQPGAVAALAPTITGNAWARTSAVAQDTTIEVTSHVDHTDLDLQLLRDGVVVATAAAPHVGPVDMVDEDPPIGAMHTYTARHVLLDLVGAQSAPTDQWAGPAKPTGLFDSTGASWYRYAVQWDAPVAGAVTRVQDNYLCIATFAERGLTAADALDFDTGGLALEKNSALEPNGNIGANFDARARHEVTAFAVTDVSDWTLVDMTLTEIAADETAINSCP